MEWAAIWDKHKINCIDEIGKTWWDKMEHVKDIKYWRKSTQAGRYEYF